MWRLVEFDTLGLHCRVLIRLNEEAAKYQAILAVDAPDGLRVLCHHELHIGEKGWHCHLCTCNVPDVFPGVLRDRERMRAREMEPSKAGGERFTVTKATALTKAAERFRFRAQGELV